MSTEKKELKTNGALSSDIESIHSEPAEGENSFHSMDESCYGDSFHSMYEGFYSSWHRIASESNLEEGRNDLPSNSEVDLNAKTTFSSISFAQDMGSFACGTNQGFIIYKCYPFEEVWRKDFGKGKINIVEMVQGWNTLAIVGGENNTEFPHDKVTIWNDCENKRILELSFDSKVVALKCRGDCIVVVLKEIVLVYKTKGELEDMKLVQEIKTISNPEGICDVCKTSSENHVLACLGMNRGQIRVQELGLPHKVNMISAYVSDIACLSLSLDASLLATASDKGTLVHLFSTLDGTCLQQVRRGLVKTRIYSISFSEDMKWLGVTSNRGTVHVFDVEEQVLERASVCNDGDDNGDGNCKKQKEVASNFTKGVLRKCLTREWSFAQFHRPEVSKCVIGFERGRDNKILIVGLDGSFCRCEVDPLRGGKMVVTHHERFNP